MEAWHTDDESHSVRHALPLALVSLAACTASHGLVITRSATNATVSVDAARVPAEVEARDLHLQELAAKACAGAEAHITSQRLSTRDEVQLDVDRVWASFQKNGPASAWTQSPGPANPLNSRSTIPVSTSLAQPDERSVRVPVPVWELSIECGG